MTAPSANGIYEILCWESGKRYIGSSKNPRRRWSTHIWMLRHGNHHSSHLQRAFNKHGEKAFQFSIIESVGDFADLRDREQWWMNHYAGSLYNQAPYAVTNAGVRRTTEARERSAAFHRGAIRSAATRARISSALTGNVNGRFSARAFCGKGHSHSGDNLYGYTLTNGKARRACKTCMQLNNRIQATKRAAAADFARSIIAAFPGRYAFAKNPKIHPTWMV